MRADLFKNILLCGGTTLLPGFSDRLKHDIQQAYKKFVNGNPNTDLEAKVQVLAPPRRVYNVFTGGCLFIKILNNMDAGWITKQEYSENGPRIIQ